MTTTVNSMHGAEMAVLNARFEGVVRKMANTLLRTGRSGVLNRARDFSCCIVTRDCELLTAADSLPIHVLSGPDLMARSMMDFHAALKRGDAFLHNSPYHGCSHAADHTILVPVIDDEGTHHFTVLAKAHQADIGNASPTTYNGAAADIYEEGALIFPATKVQEDYQSIEDIVRMCEMRIRVPEQWRGDFLAMVGAARIGERELLKLALEYGWEALHLFAEKWFDYSETCMHAALRKLPEKNITRSSTHDRLPGIVEQEITINAGVSTMPGQGKVMIDLRDNIDCLPCGLNVSEACVRTAAMIGLFNSIGGDIPKNAGSFRRIEILLRENSIVGIPKHPYSCSAATTNVADRIANAVQGAFAEIADGYGMAEIGANLPPCRGVFSGRDPRTGNDFVNQIFLGSSGGGATAGADCWLHYSHAGNGGMGFLDSVELAELYQPVKVHTRKLLQDTEGAGRRRGAASKLVEVAGAGGPVRVAFVTDGMDNPARGVRGGGGGGAASQYLLKEDRERIDLPACMVLQLEPGQRLFSVTCGGGGYGPAAERDVGLVEKDMNEGWISKRRAGEVYGVVFKRNGEVDAAKTRKRRSAMRTRNGG